MNALCDNNYMPCVPYRLKQLLYLTILIEFHTLLDTKMKARTSKPVLIPIFNGHSVVFKISLKFCWDEISAHISACKETLTENENDKGDKQTLALRLDKLMVSARGICLL